jgi:hypothetical protein
MKNLPKLIALVIVGAAYLAAKPRSIDSKEQERFANTFAFEKHQLDKVVDTKPKFVREVHPNLSGFSTWISSVGAAVAIFDFDGDGIENDIAHIDPRYDAITISPARGGLKRFAPFSLKHSKVLFDKTMAPTGVLANDFNEDGKMDLLIVYIGRSPVIFYQNDKGFSDEEVVPFEIWNTTAVTLADINGDSHADIVIGNYFPEDMEVLNNVSTTSAHMQHSMSRGDNGGSNFILMWEGVAAGKASFKKKAQHLNDFKIPKDWTLALAAADLNGDLLPELYVSNDFGPDKLLLNTTSKSKPKFFPTHGLRKFNTVRSSVVGHDSFKGMGADIQDFDGDGFLDIYVSNIADDYALHESHFMFINNGRPDKFREGIAPFENKSEYYGISRSSWAWESKIVDFNNDGIMETIQATGFVKGEINRWPQLQELATINDELLSSPKSWPHLKPGDDLSGDAHVPLFAKSESGTYYDISALIGINENQISRGISICDPNRDGQRDFIVANQWEDSHLYLNNQETDNSFLALELFYPIAPINQNKPIVGFNDLGRPAIGAKAILTLKNGRQLVGYVDGGNGHSGANSKAIHFSLGESIPNDKYEVFLEWNTPNGTKSSKIAIKEGYQKIALPLN